MNPERQIEKALARISKELIDGLRHGHFSLTVEVTTIQNQTRRVIIRAGKSYEFRISDEELRRAA